MFPSLENRTGVLLAAALTALAGVASSALADNQVSFTDGTFANADWTLTLVTTGTGGTATGTQNANGNPGTGRRVVHNVNGGTTSVQAQHMNIAGANIMDLASGDIITIDCSIMARYNSGVGGNGQTIAFLVEQAGVRYASSSLTTGSSGNWVTRSASLTAASFSRVDGLPGTPDFSSAGAPLTFGYRTVNNGSGGGAFSQTVTYDNFSVIVHRNTLFAADSDFAIADWNVTPFVTGNGGTPTATQLTSGGNPDNCRRVVHLMNSGAAGLQTFHEYLPATGTILPSQGTIDRIEMTLDAKYNSGVGGNGHQIGIALEQGGIAYRTTGQVTNATGSWVTRQSAWLKASDFIRFDGVAGNPDFSTGGGPIQLGFCTANSKANGGSYNQVVSYDNWSVRVHFVACKSDLSSDGLVDDTDFVLFATAYDMLDCADPAMPAGCPADITGDGLVDDSDFVQFAEAYDALQCL
ncbi:MAG: hypothetical protein JSS51_05280 [Planctomycetes bacterium]|nr:hypothetical protein [Planctomycetota bacterium]